MKNRITNHGSSQGTVSNRRTRSLELQVRAIQRVVVYDRRQGIEPDDTLLPLAVRTAVELADRTGTIGVRDDERVEWLVRLFRVEHAEIEALWSAAIAEAKAHRERIETAALAKFREGGEPTMRLGRRVQAQELSAALGLTKARKQAIFTAPRTILDGRIVVGKRPSSGLPDYVPEGEISKASGRPVAAWSCTKIERRYLIDRLGYKADTIRRNRNLPEGEFWFRAIKREAQTMPADKLVGMKLPGESDYHASRRIRGESPFTRTRKPGITVARRRYAKANNIGMTKAKALTQDMTEAEILDTIQQQSATVLPHSVTPATRYGCNARPDKKGVNPASSPNISCHQGSNQVSRYKGSEAPVTELYDLDLCILERWYLCTQGKALKPGTIRQWRYRTQLDAKLYEACEWTVRDGETIQRVLAHAEARIVAYQEKHDADRRAERIDRSLTGKVLPFTKAA